MDKHQSSIKTRIRVLFIILMTVTITLVGSIVFYHWKTAVDAVIVEKQDETNTAILDTIEKFINVPPYINAINHHIIENQIVDIYAEKQREMYFAGVMNAVEEHVYSFSYGTERGEYYGARRNTENKIEVMRNDATTGGKSQYYSILADLTTGAVAEKLGDFDPRTREWYMLAKKTGRPAFSAVYKHFIMNDLAISASYPIYDKQGILKGVLGTHITLSKLNSYLQEAVEDEKAIAYIIERSSGDFVANSLGNPNFDMSSSGQMNRVNIEKIDNQEIVEAYRQYKNTTKNDSIVNTKNKKLYVKISQFKKSELDWLIITAIPESHYTADLNKSIYIAVLLSIFAIILAIFIWTKSIDRYLKPIYSLILTTEKFSRGDLAQRAELFRNDEIGKLASSFNEMGEKLHLLINNLEEQVVERTSQLSETKDKLELLSQTDFLTNLYNRRYILGKMEDETRRYTRTKKNFAIIMGDIDNFKVINDTYGHDCGDLILKEVASILQTLARATDCVSRWGGEEFLLLVTETEMEGAINLAERFRQAIAEKEFEYQEIRLKMTMTFGVAVYNEGMDIDAVIKNADVAVYRGKDGGRDRVEPFKA